MSRTVAVSLIIVAALVACALFLLQRSPSQRAPRPTESSAMNENQHPSSPPVASSAPDQVAGAGGVVKSPQNEPVVSATLDARTLTTCRSALLQKRNMERINCDSVKPDDAAGQSLCRNQLAALAKRLEGVAANTASCPAELVEPSGYYKALRAIALSGDVGAQRCFIQGRFNDADRGERITEEEVKDYVTLAKELIDAGLQRGDWSLVQWLGRIRLEFGDGLLGQAHPIGQSHPETIYRMKYLLTLGGQAKNDPDDAKKIVDLWQHNKILSDKQLREAEEWARTMYAQHFAGSQEGTNTPGYAFCDLK
jgi:hypothetical protein